MFRTFQGNIEWIGREAPELEKSEHWHNSKPLTLKDLKGKIVLLDFMTYSCINCIRTFPYLNAWYEKYSEKGLEIIGIHSPEFDFEKDPENVEKGLQEFNIKFPVMQDNEYRNWKIFSNHWWPRKLLIDKNSIIRYDHIGEGNYQVTEKKIQELLGIEETPSAGIDPVMMPHTQELYCGYKRGRIGNMEGLKPEHEHNYKEEKVKIRGLVYIKGNWLSKPEYLHHYKDALRANNYIYVKFLGKSANSVLGMGFENPYLVKIEMDKQPLTEENKGRDVFIRKGESFIKVNQFKRYELVQNAQYGEHKLKLISESREFSAYAFTFGG